MWLEVKAMITAFSCIFIAIVISQILLYDILLGFLLFMGLFLYIFGDIILGWQITRTHAKYIMDKPPDGKIIIPLFTITGLLDFVWATKKPYGQREFVYNKQEASVVDKGDYPIHMLNGGHGCIAHESCDENINMTQVKYAEKLTDDFQTDNIKEIYARIKELETQNRGL